MASWACSLRYRLVRWVRLTRLTTFLGAQGEGGGRHRLPCGLCPGWHPGLPADLRGDKAPGPAHGAGTRGPGGRGGHSPAAAGAGGTAAQQGALAALGTQEGIMLVLQLQQLGAHLLVPAHICGGAGGSWAPPRAPYTTRMWPPAHREASRPSRPGSGLPAAWTIRAPSLGELWNVDVYGGQAEGHTQHSSHTGSWPPKPLAWLRPAVCPPYVAFAGCPDPSLCPSPAPPRPPHHSQPGLRAPWWPLTIQP